MKVDTQKLKGKIVEMGTTQEAVADAIHISRSTFCRKMKGLGRSFTIEEVHSMIAAIPLTEEEAIQIFLAKQSRK